MSKYEGYDEETRRKLEEYDRIQEEKEAKRQRRRERRKELAGTFKWLTPEVLAESLRERFTSYYWSTEGFLGGLGSGRQAVDVVGKEKGGHRVVYIEVEGGRAAPVSNTAKVWHYVEAVKVATPVLLIQLFSPYYDASEGLHHTRMKEAIFIGEHARMTNKSITYRSLGPADWPADTTQLEKYVNGISELIP
jgi:hypothetical protein